MQVQNTFDFIGVKGISSKGSVSQKMGFVLLRLD